MSRALRIKIINYLRENDAVAKYVDIRAHVLNDKDSVEERNEFKATLDYLSNKRLIAVNGSYEFLHWIVTYGLYNLDNKVIAIKLTRQGQSYHPEDEEDQMEITAKPVLAVIKNDEDVKQHHPSGTADILDAPKAEVEPQLPWYTEPKEEIEAAVPSVEPQLPWYTEPKEEIEAVVPPVEPHLPWYTEPKEEIEAVAPDEPQLPWYTEPEPVVFENKVMDDFDELKYEDLEEPQLHGHIEPGHIEKSIVEIPVHKHNDEPQEPKLLWHTEVKHEEAKVPIVEAAPATVVEKAPPVIYRFPPLESKTESTIKAPTPMVIEILNENLSNSIDAISNIKLRKPAMLTGDFEKDTNVVLKFVLVIVLFLLFGCIVWLYMG